MNKVEISIIILTYNEEIHIQRCLESIKDFSENIFVVDSNSKDKTIEIAKNYTKNIFYGDFSSFSDKLNWAISELPIVTYWTMRLDADEILTEDFKRNFFIELNKVSSKIGGIYIKRQLWFLNKWMRYGDMYPTYSMRIWKTKEVICENRLLDEHMILNEGISITMDLDIIDNPLTSISNWINKHDKYSNLEVITYYIGKNNANEIQGRLFGKQEERKRWLKQMFYKIPLFVRPFMYFFYRYILKVGFLDGKKGFIWHILHGFWYRFLVDVKIYEIELKAKESNMTYKEIIKQEYGYEL